MRSRTDEGGRDRKAASFAKASAAERSRKWPVGVPHLIGSGSEVAVGSPANGGWSRIERGKGEIEVRALSAGNETMWQGLRSNWIYKIARSFPDTLCTGKVLRVLWKARI